MLDVPISLKKQIKMLLYQVFWGFYHFFKKTHIIKGSRHSFSIKLVHDVSFIPELYS